MHNNCPQKHHFKLSSKILCFNIINEINVSTKEVRRGKKEKRNMATYVMLVSECGEINIMI